ncbi:hypothetical protein GOV03_02600 [Candidatus Woesearchaeota archaeon]|nr:hypothetical protein [Candidatus Woesearchaeota archaeon]
MDKKGSSIIMIIIELVAVVFVVAMTFSIAQGMAKGERVEKVNLAEDLRMMIDTLIGVPGDVVAEYPANVSKYVFTLSKNEIRVFQDVKDEVNLVVRKIHLPESYDAHGSLNERARLCLEKKKYDISLRPCGADEK